jgi:hypothetical protein
MLYVAIITFSTFSMFSFMFFLLTCRPISFFWEAALGSTGGSCLSAESVIAVNVAHGVLMCGIDVALAIISLLLVSTLLQLNRRGKILVASLLALGSM